jgi:hypothetical protein
MTIRFRVDPKVKELNALMDDFNRQIDTLARECPAE